VVRYAYYTKSPESVKGEYTMQTLIAPKMMYRPFEEKVSDLIMHPSRLCSNLPAYSCLYG